MKINHLNIRLFLAALLIAVAPSLYAAATDSLTYDADELAERIEAEARTHLGKHYHHGSSGPSTFDCSGFTSYVYSKFGYNLSHSSKSQAQQGRAIPAVEGTEYYKLLQKGDIVVFNGRKISKTNVGHVGIFLEADTVHHCFKFIHASNHSGITISRSDEPYYKARFLYARRFLPDFDGEETVVDSTAAYPFDEVGKLHHPTHLKLDSTDMQIVLFGNGRWAKVDSKGHVTPGEADERIILGKDGYWSVMKMPKVNVPASAAKSIKKDAGSSSDKGNSDATLDDDDNADDGKKTAADSTAVSSTDDKANASKSSASTGTASSEKEYHKVKQGETLYSISKRYGTTVSKLCSLNGIRESSTLQIGQRLRVK